MQARVLLNMSGEKTNITLKTDGKIRYTVPSKITSKKDVKVYFRVADVYRNVKINVLSGGEVIFSKKKPKVAPGEMETVMLKKDMLENVSELSFELEVM